MKIFTFLAAAAISAASFTASANPRFGILIDANSVEDIDNYQEYAAASYFVKENPDGAVIAPGEASKIDARNLDCIWIHIDRVAMGHGHANLPAAFNNAATIEALKKFVADGGNLLLTKHATQLLVPIGRIDNKFAPGIFGDGEGGLGSDIWTIQAHIGLDNMEADPTQYYDRTTHDIYNGLEVIEAHHPRANFDSETFPMEGTADGSDMHREDHNCMWDLNIYSYAADGKNTVEKFENENNAKVLGTWGHVKDYAVAGIVEFEPTATVKGHIIANGLAACEWSPRTGVNAYHSNLEKLTANSMNYLAKYPTTGVDEVGVDEDENVAPVYYTISGVAVENPTVAGIYIMVKGNKTTKIVVR